VAGGRAPSPDPRIAMSEISESLVTTHKDASSRFAWPRLTMAQRQARLGLLFISPWIIGFLVFTLGALIFSLVISLYNTDLLTRGYQ